MKTVALTFAVLLAGAAYISALAEELPDPTRPPSALGTLPTPGSPGETGGGDMAKKGLQSVIISPSRRAAIINGKTVELGGKYNGAKLTEVNENGVVLSGARGRQKLLLMFPAVEIRKNNTPSSP